MIVRRPFAAHAISVLGVWRINTPHTYSVFGIIGGKGKLIDCKSALRRLSYDQDWHMNEDRPDRLIKMHMIKG